MTKSPARIGSKRYVQLEKVLTLLRTTIPKGELDTDDWDAIRVAVRLVYETEDLRVNLQRKRKLFRDYTISYWSDSMEGAITFMSWIRELTSIVTGVTYSTSTPVSVGALWRRHRTLALRLLDARLTPAKRMSVLVELGGIEVSLWGQTWALEPMSLRQAETGQQPAVKAARKRQG